MIKIQSYKYIQYYSIHEFIRHIAGILIKNHTYVEEIKYYIFFVFHCLIICKLFKLGWIFLELGGIS